MELFIIALTAFVTAILTFFSGFGLGTLLAPVMMLFFAPELAIALTGVVHFFNNVFKLFLVGRHANCSVLIRFGLPAVAAAFLGAWVMLQIPSGDALFSYGLAGRMHEVDHLSFFIGLVLLAFAILEFLPQMKRLEISARWLPFGGFLSGFFGGLSGHQGALRTAFLIKAGLTKEAFIGTAVVVSACVDVSRIGVYVRGIGFDQLQAEKDLLVVASLSAITGAWLGNALLKKVSMEGLRMLVGFMLLAIAVALCLGLV